MTRHRLRESIPDFVFDNLDAMKEKRTSLDLSKQQVAEIAGVSDTTINNFECAYKLPSRETYNRLARVFDWRIWL